MDGFGRLGNFEGAVGGTQESGRLKSFDFKIFPARRAARLNVLAAQRIPGIDGQQRLRAVLDYLRGDFPIAKAHNADWGGAFYDDLDPATHWRRRQAREIELSERRWALITRISRR